MDTRLRQGRKFDRHYRWCLVLRYLNILLREFIRKAASLTADQVGFQPPDQDWQTYVGSHLIAVNAYLLELRENVRLRSNERYRSVVSGVVSEQPAPRRMDCHYLITAWNAAEAATDPALDEHDILYRIGGALMDAEALVPEDVFAPDPLPSLFPPELADSVLPMVVLPAEGFAKYAEFWGTMGTVHPWKAGIYLIITIPVILGTTVSGPMVTTALADYGRDPVTAASETWINIGGHVLDGKEAPPLGVAAAWVGLENASGTSLLQSTRTDSDGRFVFGGIRPGSYRLRCRAAGFAEPAPRAVDVPSPTGEYDVVVA
jgi:hypothetical protein